MAAPPPPPAGRELRPLDPRVWRALAGTTTRIPSAGSSVFYFPQGHAEQSSSQPDFTSLPHRRPAYSCRVAAVGYLANPDTDEVFAKILLDPRPPLTPPPPPPPDHRRDDESAAVSFRKILTPSDANNGGGFSVPRYCADSIFPPLDFTADPPLQKLSIRDVHGVVWNFRHIYRGTPRRHLLTTGWSNFVNSKLLVAGDSVIFVRNRDGELFVGVRRAVRSCGSSVDYLRYSLPAPPGEGGTVKLERDLAAKDGFSRDVKGRVPPESVVEAVRLAEMNQPFEVIYYPRAGSADFVVDAEVVEAATRKCWNEGMRIKMSVEMEDSSSTSSMYQGTISGTAVHDPSTWPHSPWRMLQITLDEVKTQQSVKSVNPWQVELESTTFNLPTSYPPIKRMKTSPTSELPNNLDASMYFPATGFKGTMLASVVPSYLNYNKFPAGMQGARQISSSYESCVSDLPHKNTDNLFSGNGNKRPEKLNDVSTELSIGSTSDSSSPHSQCNNIQCNDMEFSRTITRNSSRKNSSFQLFGQIIEMDQHFNSDAGKEHKEEEDAVQFPFPYQPKQLVTGLDIRSGRVSTLETCPL